MVMSTPTGVALDTGPDLCFFLSQNIKSSVTYIQSKKENRRGHSHSAAPNIGKSYDPLFQLFEELKPTANRHVNSIVKATPQCLD
jgi:hypothetical protein